MIDILHFISYLNCTKLSNFLKTILSYVFSLFLKKTIVWGLPCTLSIEPIARCNLKCPECAIGSGNFHREKGEMSIELATKILNETHRHLLHLFLYFQGEPFLSRTIFELIHIAKKKKIYTVISTNAQLITSEIAEQIIISKLDKIIISLDGISQESYEKYRVGGNVQKALDAIRYLAEFKRVYKSKKPYISVQYLVLSCNEGEINEAKIRSKKLGANEFKLKTAQFYNFENGNELMPRNPKYNRYKRLSTNKFVLKNSLPNRCSRLWFSSVIGFDGKVAVCCFDKDIEFLDADISKQNLKTIWKSDSLMNFRKKILKQRNTIPICCNCTEGLKI